MGVMRRSPGETDAVVRRMTVKDLPAAVRLFIRIYREAPYRERWARPDAAAYLRRIFELDRTNCFAAEGGKTLRGVLIGYPYPYHGNRVFYMHELFVARPFRRKGIARALLREATGGEGSETVFTMFAHRQSGAMKFYRRHGFRQHENYRFYFSRVDRRTLGNGRNNGKRK